MNQEPCAHGHSIACTGDPRLLSIAPSGYAAAMASAEPFRAYPADLICGLTGHGRKLCEKQVHRMLPGVLIARAQRAVLTCSLPEATYS